MSNLITSYLCPRENGADFLTKVVFLYRNRERIVSDYYRDKSLYYIVNQDSAAILYYPTSLDKVLRDMTL